MANMVHRDRDVWRKDGKNILDPKTIEVIRSCLESGPIIVEHWFYCSAISPVRMVEDDFEEFLSYIERNAFPGDAFFVWSFSDLCQDGNSIAAGKCPDSEGRVPDKGAY